MSLDFIAPSTGVQIPPPRIVGGYEVEPAFKYPAMVALQMNGNHKCGGTLYNGNSIITAAHCVIGNDSEWTAKFHRHDFGKTDEEEGGKTFQVIKRIPHPLYNDTLNTNDIAIWKIDAPVGKRTNVEIDTGKLGNEPDTLLATIGWGRTSDGGISSKKLLEVKLPVFPIEQCAINYSKEGEKVFPDVQICAGYPEGQKDACQGDSGGPLFKYIDGKQVLVGLVSWGTGCAMPNLPGVYTKVSIYDRWIKETINNTQN